MLKISAPVPDNIDGTLLHSKANTAIMKRKRVGGDSRFGVTDDNTEEQP